MADSKNAVAATNTEVDLKAMLEEDHESEMSDHDKYMELAMIADEKYPCRGYGAILRDIAKEEEIHRKHIKAILEDMSKWAGEDNG